jgi:hypothetical protein
MTQLIELTYSNNTESGWAKFYDGLEKTMLIELAKRNIEPKELLFRGIKYSNLNRAIQTGNDLKNNEIYAAAILSGQHTIRTALEYGLAKGSKKLFSRYTDYFAVTCYEKRYFSRKDFLENLTYHNYKWVLKEGISYKDALIAIFMFKRIP